MQYMLLMNNTNVHSVCWFVFLKGTAWGEPPSTKHQAFLSQILLQWSFCVYACTCSLGCPGVWSMKWLAGSVFCSEQLRPSQLCGTCIWKGRKMFYISLTKQGSPVSFFPYSSLNFQQLLLFFLSCFTQFCPLKLLKSALSHSHVRGLCGWKQRMVSRCDCVFLSWLLCMPLNVCVCVPRAGLVCDLEPTVLPGHVEFEHYEKWGH